MTGKRHFASATVGARSAPDIVHVTARAQTASAAQGALALNLKEVMAEHRIHFDAAEALLRERHARLSAQLAAFNEHIALLRAEIEQTRETEPVQASMFLIESGSYMARIPDLEERLHQVEQRLLGSNTYPTRLIGEPTLPAKPVEPKTPLILALALILGLIFGAFAALAAELMRARRSRGS